MTSYIVQELLFNHACVGEGDCYEIMTELDQVAHRWDKIGLALGLTPSTLERIRTDQADPWRTTITEWLKMKYNVQRFGKPTWRRIVEAVRAKSGGGNPALANTLAAKYSGNFPQSGA